MSTSAHRISSAAGLISMLASASCGSAAGDLPGWKAGEPERTGECAPENLTAPCQCADRGGRQLCTAGMWSSCDCAAGAGGNGAGGGGAGGGPGGIQPGNDRTDITFDWQSTAEPIEPGTCPPGRYEGNLQGVYWSILDPTRIGLPITNIDLPGAPSGFHFDLEPAQGGETIQRVKGEVDGLADLLFPFKARIEGTLNCRSGVFNGRLIDGHYSILAEGVLPQTFDGVASAKYDKRTHTFVNGTWDVRETSAVPPGTLAPSMPRNFTRDGFGGAGDFAAALPTDLSDPNLKACPASFACRSYLLGPNKLLCNGLLGAPACVTDADCAVHFPGEGVMCLKASLFSLCVRECKP
jgi:hypothetical protein